MKKAFSILAAVCLLCACGEYQTEIFPATPNKHVTVRFSVYTSDPVPVTRTTDENHINDLNIYLVNDMTKDILHTYSQSPTAQFSCRVNNYRLFIIANAHADLGDKTYEQIVDYRIQYDPEQEDLVMTAQRTLSLKPSDQPVVLPPIDVKRVAAKIAYNIRVDTSMPDIEIRGVQVVNLPLEATPFGENTPSVLQSDYTAGGFWDNTEAANQFTGCFYMLPNVQGRIAGITDERQKNPDNAPSKATYMRIRAMRGVKIIDYFVYLGENNTDDFNVRSNTQNTLNITIRSDNDMDVRIRLYTLEVVSEPQTPPVDGFCTSLSPIVLNLLCGGKFEEARPYATLKLKAGNPRFFSIQGSSSREEYPLDIAGSTTRFLLEYRPTDFRRENILLTYEVTFYDKYGYVTSFEFSYCFARSIKVYTKWYVDGDICGNVNCAIKSPDALHFVRGGTMSSVYFTFFYTDDGCTLIAVPDNDSREFSGWYKQYNILGKISSEPILKCTPATISEQTIYAYFR